jgi:hypothetical protein
MEYFLQHIAKSLHSEFGNTLNRHCLVFPGRRAGLFFLKYLSAELKSPVWSPKVMTINELFKSCSDLRAGENEILLFELYKVYRVIAGTQESFDDFFFWGDMLLNDFDDVDKYLVDASQLFSNISDLKKIDQQFGDLSQEQSSIIKQFWVNFNPEKQTGEKSKFLDIWSNLYKIYTSFRNNLKEHNLAYEGMIFRDVAERKLWNSPQRLNCDMVHFVGFNALNKCEKAIMSGLKAEEKARFYWDFDNSYVKPGKLNSAGFFLKEDIATYGNDMPAGWVYDTLLSSESKNVKRRAIDASSDIAQVKLLPQLIDEFPDQVPDSAHQTAVILADESLLIPVLSSLPGKLGDINITMGYPYRQTAIYLLIRQLLEMQDNAKVTDRGVFFGYRDVMALLKNNLIADIVDGSGKEIVKEIIEKNILLVPASMFVGDEILASIFRKPTATSMISEYLKSVLTLIAGSEGDKQNRGSTGTLPANVRNEFIYRAILAINRLSEISAKSDLIFTVKTWTRILDRLLRSQSVPFSGEPLTGIQIMGILETRTLDFKNLIILSVNEGILPSITGPSSYIPFSLRQAFGLPSINHQESIYAYHFYRLLHRAENITFVYNSNPEGLRSGEISRFLQQMKFEAYRTPEFINLNFEIRNPETVGTLVERIPEHSLVLLDRFSGINGKGRLSPMAVNMWLNCRMKFYYRYVNGLKEPDKITEEIDPAMLGILLHECMKHLYGRFSGKVLEAANINRLIHDSHFIFDLIDQTIQVKFSQGNNQVIAVNETIVRNVIFTYISRILETDCRIAPFTITAVEKPVGFNLPIGENEPEKVITVGGTIDRIDLKDSTTRIVDYKTGTITDSLSSVSLLFEEDRQKGADAWLQTMLYCEAYLADHPEPNVAPSVYKVKKIASDDNSDKLYIKTSKKEGFYVDNYKTVRAEFMEGLKGIVKLIFSREEPFNMTTDTHNKCPYCPYRILCMR